nr:MAG TPA: hypothetical protein [Caudoviricetes sp.]
MRLTANLFLYERKAEITDSLLSLNSTISICCCQI